MPIKCMLNTLFRKCKQGQIIRKKQTVYLAASNSGHPRCLAAVTVDPIYIDYEEELWRHTPFSEGSTHAKDILLRCTSFL